VYSAIPVATTAIHSAQNIAMNEVGRQAIVSDPNWKQGNYYDSGPPEHGLAVARMIGHICYLSESSMQEKFGRKLQDKDKISFDFDFDFQVESYLRHQGYAFTQRFDANSYLYITKALDYFDLSDGYEDLADSFHSIKSKFLVISFTGDWLYPPHQSKQIVKALKHNELNVSYYEVESDYGHDAFLLDDKKQNAAISSFLDATWEELSSHDE
jgi:homoserine O-acetyltransferase